MQTGAIRGNLLSSSFAARLEALFAGRLGEVNRAAAERRLRRLWRRSESQLGPASPLRAVVDLAAVPLLEEMGFRLGPLECRRDICLTSLEARGRMVAGVLVTPWAASLDRHWRDAVRQALRAGARWALCCNGCRLRLVDAERTYTRRFLEFDLAMAADDSQTFAVFWGLLRPEAFGRGAEGLLDEAVSQSDRHASAVCASLRTGVDEALALFLHAFQAPGRRQVADTRVAAAFEQSLTVIYRILFLLFAEARGLVPVWHPIYRASYTIEALRELIEPPGRPRGLWEALQAIARLAHAGCRAGDLVVTPFNGRLFAPAGAPLAESLAVGDEPMRRALRALTTAPAVERGGAGRERIAYQDLGVEQLGAVYERVLDYEPAPGRAGAALALGRDHRAHPGRTVTFARTGHRRKSSGTFYTPRALTDYLVRRTLHPLVAGAAPETILSLRVLDPAMGSGAFLVAACRYLAAAYERALLGDGASAADISDEDRAGFARAVAQRCLYGVDLNPTAVQLGRLSLWLATLAAGQPLTFLDHRLRAGNSLAGASLEDLRRRPPGPRGAGRHQPAALPLFPQDDARELRTVLGSRERMAREPDATVEAVRRKERTLAALEGAETTLARWKRAADCWCAYWFWPRGSAPPPPRAYASLSDAIMKRRPDLPPQTVEAWLESAAIVAREQRFFHWTLEFPEAFFDAEGRPLERPGFDAVLGNPPWDVLRGDLGDRSRRNRARDQGRALSRFARGSGIYTAQGTGHANLYQLFTERALALVRRGGRLGLVLPAGLAMDHGCAPMRRLLFEGTDLDALVSFDNRDGIFPIHRGLKFLLLTATAGGRTERLRCRAGVRSVSALDDLPDARADDGPAAFPVTVTPALLARLSGDQLAIPELRCARDLALVEAAAARWRPLSDPEGWGASFGRELNASEDRRHFGPPGGGLPVIEGKQIEPFRARIDAARFSIAEATAARLLARDRAFERSRLAYRDVASASNRLTLIAAILPAGVVTVHTVFCLRTPLEAEDQHVLCALLNSFVANFLVRMRVGTHVTTGIVEQLRAPRPAQGSAAARQLAGLARRLAAVPEDAKAAAALQGAAARLYGLSAADFAHVLDTFPLVPATEREAALAALKASIVGCWSRA